MTAPQVVLELPLIGVTHFSFSQLAGVDLARIALAVGVVLGAY